MAELIVNNIHERCKNCNAFVSPVLAEGMMTCRECGYVSRINCFARPKERYNEFLVAKTRTGTRIAQSYIRGTDGLSQHKRIQNIKMAASMEAKWRMVRETSNDRYLQSIYNAIDQIIARLHLGPRFAASAKRLAQQYTGLKIKHATRKTNTLAHVFVMLQSRKRIGLPYDTICGPKQEYIRKRELAHYLKKVTKQMKMTRAAPSFLQYIVRFASRAGMDRLGLCHCRRLCQFIVRKKILSNRNPLSVCAAMIYIGQFLVSNADKEEFTLDHIAGIVSVAKTTIVKCVRDLLLNKDVQTFLHQHTKKWDSLYKSHFQAIIS